VITPLEGKDHERYPSLDPPVTDGVWLTNANDGRDWQR